MYPDAPAVVHDPINSISLEAATLGSLPMPFGALNQQPTRYQQVYFLDFDSRAFLVDTGLSAARC